MLHRPYLLLILLGLTYTTHAHRSYATTIEGSWFRPCWQAELELSAEEVLQISGNNELTVTRSFTVQPQCGNFDFEFTAKAKVDLTNQASGLQHINLTWQAGSVMLKPLSSTAASGFNELKVCGISDWQTQVPRHVSGLYCEGFHLPKEGETYYQIVAISNGKLHFGYTPGQGFQNANANERPRALDRFNPYEAGLPAPTQRRRAPLVRPVGSGL